MKVDIFKTDKKYDVIYADPPWRYDDKGCQGAAERHYSTLTLEGLKGLPVKNISNKDCVLLMWATYPKLREALEVIKAWGFTYKSIGFQWIKLNKSGNGEFFGLGRWTRGNTEPCLLAVKGKPKRVRADISQLVKSPLRKHSQKPDIVRKKIADLLGKDCSKIELFAREQADDWDCWGNEV